MREKATAPSGVLIIDKPEGPTSHDIVDHVRKLTGVREVGHSGTLDPFATGVLVVAIGSATRLLEYTRALPKTYRATITLGATSDTDDRTGNITPRTGNTPGVELDSSPGVKEVRATLQTFIGKIQQVPPQYSAIKVAGKRSYAQARVGETVALKPRPVIIHSIKLFSYNYPTLELEVICGGGTYIRALARDIGEALGTGAYVQALRRTTIGPFDVQTSLAPHKLSPATLPNHLLPPEKLVEHLPRITLDSTNVVKFRLGQGIDLIPEGEVKSPIAIFDENNSLIGIGKYEPITSLASPKPSAKAGLLHPLKVL